jgi:acyl-homoserine lactone acylase PvdQ
MIGELRWKVYNKAHGARHKKIRGKVMSTRWMATAVVALLAISMSGAALAKTPAAPTETIDLPGLDAPVTVYRDAEGIAHIAATNRHDLYFVTGWIHAEDRLFQADLTRRQPSGTLAELFGSNALAGDVQARTILSLIHI